ncbi:SDR family NAD(P)-dependent oxidoreductase [Pararhizobium qamdonense]|uniref:SDR family NAD(P)-dependent oxidoreductase n=1 Tax=Pararhizobium qamdonense TaxID=3031126 RepID=UPI0023E1C818|nr:SDR family NAD(P)-dependent oxidoreductase [Pararhizobium qamdonense]
MTSFRPNDLTGRRILITGAGGGIGAASARLCSAHGAEVALVDIADVDTIRRTVGELSGPATFHSCDTSSKDAVSRLSGATGPVYGLVDCAAICPPDDWMDESWDEALDRTIAVNIKGPANLTRAYYPKMVEQGGGRIVLFGSVAGWMGGLRSGPHYAFTKGGIHAFTRWLAQRGAEHNVTVNAIAPGPIDTPMIMGRGYEPDAVPLKRLAAPEEVGAFVLLLCAPGGGFASGAIFDVNGATHLR